MMTRNKNTLHDPKKHNHMNSILQKCLDELNKETFRKDYVIGMLETLIEMQGISAAKTALSAGLIEPGFKTAPASMNDEGSLLTAQAASAMGRISAGSITSE